MTGIYRTVTDIVLSNTTAQTVAPASFYQDGVVTALIGMTTVFLGLLVMYLVLRWIDSILNKPVVKPEKKVDPDEELAAIIGLSIYLRNEKYYEAKKCILTGKKDAFPYMPWVVMGRKEQHTRDERRIHRI